MLRITVALSLLATACGGATPSSSPGSTTARTRSPQLSARAEQPLRVLLYPYIPKCPGATDHRRTEDRLEAELRSLGVTAEVDIADPGGRLYERTAELFTGEPRTGEPGYDVVEIDTMLLDGVIDHIQPLSVDLSRMHPAARSPVEREEATWGVPHWLCGFFLYTREPTVAEAPSAQAMVDALAALDTPAPDLVGDASSSWDLPALYLDAWHDHPSPPTGGHASLVGAPLAGDVVGGLATFLSACRQAGGNPCVDGGFENHAASAAAAYDAGEADALFGYSERLASLSQETSISTLPLGPRRGPPPLFSDAFVVARDCTGRCLERASRAIDHLVSTATYDWLLSRAECEGQPRPRYLLPAARAAWDAPSLSGDQRYARLRELIRDGVAFPVRGYGRWRSELKANRTLVEAVR